MIPAPPLENELAQHQILFPYGIGIDTHSKFIQVCVLQQVGSKILRQEKEFPTDWHSLLAAHDWAIAQIRVKVDPSQLRYCIESTGTYHFPVLLAWRGCPSVVNPLLAGPSRRKTDVLDAQMLATHSITGVWKPSFIPSQQAQELRVIWAQRREAARSATRCSNRINNIILRFGHSLGSVCAMRSSQAEGVLSDLIEGRSPNVPTVCPDGLPISQRPIISKLMTDMRNFMAEVKRVEKEAKAFITARRWPTGSDEMNGADLLTILASVPGVGPTTAITWLCEVCDPRRFQHTKQVAAFAGCDPSLKVSAGKVTSHARRAGNMRLHNSLGMAAQFALTQSGNPLGGWGRSIAGRHKKGGFRKAQGAVARRIACCLWQVHFRAETFDISGYRLDVMPAVRKIPVVDVLPKRACLLLSAEHITHTQQLSDAYYNGKLALIPGLGKQTLDTIKTWLAANILTKQPMKALGSAPSPSGKVYQLEPPKKFVPSDKPRAKASRKQKE